MNHLHELLDEDVDLCMPPQFDDDLCKKALSQIRQNIKEAVCFDIGSTDSLADLPSVPNLVRLPYEVCWFEAQPDGPSAVGALVAKLEDHPETTDVDEEWAAFLFQRDRLEGVHTWSLVCIFHCQISYSSDKWTIKLKPEAEKPTVQGAMNAIASFLTAMHCVNVKRNEVRPSPRLQRARARRGKVPLFSYWTLELRPHAASQKLGGTHSSPRLHLRRGHPRQYAEGKWCWVQPHLVGDKRAGVVHKDYAMRV